MKGLITGGAGFIGSNLVRFLVSKGWEIVVLDKLTYAGRIENIEDLIDNRKCEFVQGDIANRELVDFLLYKFEPDIVFNLAAESHVDRSIDDPEDFVRTNVVGTYVLLEAVRNYIYKNKEKKVKFIHVSTDEVYGSIEKGFFTEESPYNPRSPYAATKAAADHLVYSYYITYGFPSIITNCSNNFGPYQFPEKLIPLMILNAIEGLPLPIYGDGRNVRDWLYVLDHCEALLLVAEKGKTGEKYNIGGFGERQNIEVVEEICRLLDNIYPPSSNSCVSGRIESYRELITFVEDRPGHDRRYAISPAKIVRELGWKPKYSFSNALELTVKWYLQNEKWVASLEKNVRKRRGLVPIFK